MALFDKKTIIGGLKSSYGVSATTKVNNLLRVSVLRFPESEIRSRIQNAINRASNRAAIDLQAALSDALRSNVWSGLKGTTDIYDTGELLQSGRVTVDDTGIKVVYDAPYAAIVHYGGYVLPYGNRSAAKVYLPPRPWVDAVLNGGGPVKQFNFSRYYVEELRKEFG